MMLLVRDLAVKNVRLEVGRLVFHSLAESNQKTWKVAIHSFPA